MPIDEMKQVLDSMENSVRLRSQARAERRAEEAERENTPSRKNYCSPPPARQNSTVCRPV